MQGGIILRDLRRDRSRVIRLTILSTAAYIFMVTMNFLANYLPLNDITTGAISDRYANPFTPAGFTFSIWGLIYLLLIGFTIYQALPQYRETSYVRAVGLLFALTAVFNVLWLFVWHYLRMGLAMVIILLLLITLVIIYHKIYRLKDKEGFFDWLFVRLPFSLYVAWLCVATIANFNFFLAHIGWLGTEGFGAVLFTMLMILIGTLIALYVFFERRDFAFGLVFIWAFIGIGVEQTGESILVTVTAWLSAAAILFFMGWISAQSRKVTGKDR